MKPIDCLKLALLLPLSTVAGMIAIGVILSPIAVLLWLLDLI